MKYIIAASFAMAALVGAAPVNNKRDMVYSTTTEEVWETVWSTTTIWVDPTETTAASFTSVGGFYEVKSSSTPSSAPASSTRSSSTFSSYSTPAAIVVPSSTPAAPVVPSSTSTAPSSTSTSTYVAPTPTSTYVAPAPTTTAAPTSTSVYVAPAPASTAKAAAAPVVAASTGSTATGTSTGDMTYYDVSVGLTSCGLTGSNSDFLVAMNAPDMANGVNPNNNPHCSKMINIYYNGVGPIKGTVVDTCPECVSGAIDVTDSLFKAVAPSGDGRVHGVSWSWA
jgi:hypothetical protein